jgi:Superfamily I DNA and RNA helicases
MDAVIAFDQTEETRKKHNERVALIKHLLENRTFASRECLSNPYLFSPDMLLQYQELSDVKGRFHGIPEATARELSEVSSFFADIETIKTQYDVFSFVQNTLRQKYISLRGVSLIESRLKGLSGRRFYYSLLNGGEFHKVVASKNGTYIAENVKNPLFDNVNGVSLDLSQREAIVKEEISTLVVAGAGTGKTTTICGKVLYLMEAMGVDKNDILLLSYSKNSAGDLKAKIGKIETGMAVSTFHSLGLGIIDDTNNEKQDVDDQYDAIVESFFREEMFRDQSVSSNILLYYSQFFSSGQTHHFHDEGELFESLKMNEYTTIKDEMMAYAKSNGDRLTIKKERVKSDEELAIANFYFLHGIKYEYEAPYLKQTSASQKRQYKPDFILIDYQIYHEHYGINRSGETPQYDSEAGQKYLLSMA